MKWAGGLFHYTTAGRTAMILRDNLIRVSDWPDTPPYLWVSANQRLECSSIAWRPPGRPAIWPRLARAMRFVIPPEHIAAAIAWKDVPLGYTLRRKLEKLGRRRGARPHEWLAIPYAIPASECRLETRLGDVWQAADWPQIAAEFDDLDITVCGLAPPLVATESPLADV